jgi:hypothetical protein
MSNTSGKVAFAFFVVLAPSRFICATRKLGGNGKCANHGNLSQRGGEMLPR